MNQIEHTPEEEEKISEETNNKTTETPESLDHPEKNTLDCTAMMQIIETTLLSAKDGIQDVNTTFREAALHMIELEKTINAMYYEKGIERICRLIESIRRIQDENAEVIADELTSVLKECFQVSIIRPSAGDYFDAKEHEHNDLSKSGTIIHSCALPGWKRNEKVLIKAIVVTKEGAIDDNS